MFCFHSWAIEGVFNGQLQKKGEIHIHKANCLFQLE